MGASSSDDGRQSVEKLRGTWAWLVAGVLVVLQALTLWHVAARPPYPGMAPSAPALARDRDSGDSRDIEATFRLFEQARDANDLVKADLYALNAINRRSDRLDWMKEYTEFVLGRADVSDQDLQKLRGILQVQCYHVSATTIDGILALIKRVDDKRTALAAVGEKPQPPAGPDTWNSEASKLLASAKELPAGDAGLEALASRLQEAKDTPPVTVTHEVSATTEKLEREIERIGRARVAVHQLRYLDACTNKLDLLSKEQSLATTYAATIVQASEAALVPIWGMKIDDLGRDQQAKIKTAPDRIQLWISRIASARSQGALDRIRAIVREVDGLPVPPPRGVVLDLPRDGVCEALCKKIVDALKKCQELRLGMQSRELVAEAGPPMDHLEQTLQKWRTEQHRRLERQALLEISSLLTAIEAAKTSALPEKFQQSNFSNIDERILSPPVQRAYAEVLQRLLQKLTPEDAQLVHVAIFNCTSKLKMEDF